MQLFDADELIDQFRKLLESHECHTGGRAIVAELNGAHLTAQIALSNRLDLYKMGKMHAGSGFWHENAATMPSRLHPPGAKPLCFVATLQFLFLRAAQRRILRVAAWTHDLAAGIEEFAYPGSLSLYKWRNGHSAICAGLSVLAGLSTSPRRKWCDVCKVGSEKWSYLLATAKYVFVVRLQ